MDVNEIISINTVQISGPVDDMDFSNIEEHIGKKSFYRMINLDFIFEGWMSLTKTIKHIYYVYTAWVF